MHRAVLMLLVCAAASIAGGCRPPPLAAPDAGDLDAGGADEDAGPPFLGDDVAATIDLAATSTLHCTVLGLATVYAPATNVLDVGCAQSGASIALRFLVEVGEQTEPSADARIEAVDELGVTATSQSASFDASSFSIALTIAALPPAGRAAGTFSGTWNDDGTSPAGTASGTFDVDFTAP